MSARIMPRFQWQLSRSWTISNLSLVIIVHFSFLLLRLFLFPFFYVICEVEGKLAEETDWNWIILIIKSPPCRISISYPVNLSQWKYFIIVEYWHQVVFIRWRIKLSEDRRQKTKDRSFSDAKFSIKYSGVALKILLKIVLKILLKIGWSKWIVV